MKKLSDYSEDIYKCAKCGLCQAVCPVYQETGLETAVARGKFTLLNGILNGKIKFTPKISGYLDMCLGCKACFDFCPAGISAEEIIIAARAENFKLNKISFIKKFIIWCFKSNTRLKLLKFALNLYKTTGLINITEVFSRITGKLGGFISIFNFQLKQNVKYKKFTPSKQKSALKVVYFPGCIGNYINPSAKNAVIMVLEKNGIEVKIPKNFSCCGISSRSAGDFKTFKALAECNIKLIPDDIDFLITDCASCGCAWDFYAEITEGELKEKAEIIAKKAVNINKFLDQIELYIPENVRIEETVTYHDPCHLARFQHVTKEPRNILKKIPGLIYKELEEADKCCGAAGTFCIVKPEISKGVSLKKAKNIINTNADYVSTSCSACKIGLSQGLIGLNSKKAIISPVEFLAMLYLKEEADINKKI
ncbi:MAG TPA: (Fe-S)-binding protein [Candidatus Gastranaerophilales bacterium]|nr:(Fe-S)-binding protein [Candidatus Gastranaerophilales bacterium]